MSNYVKETWVDDSGDGSSGTPVTAARMNNIEDGVSRVFTDLMPIGSIIDTVRVIPDTGWMFLDGSSLSRTTYADLFSAICPTINMTYNSDLSIDINVANYQSKLSVGMVLEFTKSGTKYRRTIGNLNSGTNIAISSAVPGMGAGEDTTPRLLPWGALSDTTFYIPDGRDRVSKQRANAADSMGASGVGGAKTKTLSVGELPVHNHSDGTLVVADHNHPAGTLSVPSSGAHQHQLYSPNTTTSPATSGAQQRLTSFGFTTPNGTYTVAGEGAHSHPSLSGSTGGTAPDVTGSTGNAGSGTAFNIEQPYMTVQRQIRYS